MTLAGTVALITGGSRGIGRAISEALALAGARVAVNYRAGDEVAKATCDAIRGAGGEAAAFRADVRDRSAVDQMVVSVEARWGRIGVLVNNAGVTRDGLFAAMSEEEWWNVLDTNLGGVVRCTQAILPSMLRRRSGRIINISSLLGETGGRGSTNYSASKGAINSFTRSLAREVAKKGITVNAIAPGLIDTDMSRDMNPKALDEAKRRIPIQRLGQTREVASLAVFLASEESSYVTGQIIGVNGGLG